MNIKTAILIGFIAPLAYILFGYRESDLPLESNKIIFEQPKEHEKPNKPEREVILIEINSVPPAFDLAGNHPYVLWINGVKINAKKQDIINFVNKIGMENIKPMTTSDIHNGWIEPHFFEKVDSDLQ